MGHLLGLGCHCPLPQLLPGEAEPPVYWAGDPRAKAAHPITKALSPTTRHQQDMEKLLRKTKTTKGELMEKKSAHSREIITQDEVPWSADKLPWCADKLP